MEAKLLKVNLKPDSKARLVELVEYMRAHPEQPADEMAQKGYYWDAFFIDSNHTLYMVLKSADFSKIMLDESQLVSTAFRAVYERFRQSCWVEGSYEDVEAIVCFNDAMSFLGKVVEEKVES